jgi:hypothetical protein
MYDSLSIANLDWEYYKIFRNNTNKMVTLTDNILNNIKDYIENIKSISAKNILKKRKK